MAVTRRVENAVGRRVVDRCPLTAGQLDKVDFYVRCIGAAA
jgi:hypothetical protein